MESRDRIHIELQDEVDWDGSQLLQFFSDVISTNNACRSAFLFAHDSTFPVDGGLLRMACKYGRASVVRFLVRAGADVDASGRWENDDALQATAYRGHKTIVRLLSKAGADVNGGVGRYGNTLQAAVSMINEAVVQLLLEAGADIEICGLFRDALRAAVVVGEKESDLVDVGTLLEAGAEFNALQGGNGGDDEDALRAATYRVRKEISQLLLEAGAYADDAPAEEVDGDALQVAACRGQRAIVQLLLETGADVNSQGGRYGNALQAAIFKADPVIVKLLLQAGADVKARGLYGDAYQAAIQRLSDAGLSRSTVDTVSVWYDCNRIRDMVEYYLNRRYRAAEPGPEPEVG